MQKFYKLLQIAALLVVALLVLRAGFALIFWVRDGWLSMASPRIRQMAYACLSALLVFSIGYYSLLWTKRIWESPTQKS